MRQTKAYTVQVATQIGRILGQNSRAAGLFEIDVQTREDGFAQLSWSKRPEWRDWAALSEGCYLLRINITDWTPDALWKAYIQLT